MSHDVIQRAWVTVDTSVVDGVPVMLQQQWELHNVSHHSQGYISMAPFPADNWRVIDATKLIDSYEL